MLPGTEEIQWYEKKTESGDEIITEYIPYYTYKVKILKKNGLNDWDLTLLDIGTFAKFGDNKISEQIYSYTVIKDDSIEGPVYTNVAGALAKKKECLTNGWDFSMAAVTEPLPLNVDRYYISRSNCGSYC